MVPGLDVGDGASHRFDDSRALVSQDGGGVHGVHAVDEVKVAMAHSAGGGADEDLLSLGLVHINLLYKQGLVGTSKHGGFHSKLLLEDGLGGELGGSLIWAMGGVNTTPLRCTIS